MCSNAADLREMAHWEGKGIQSRTRLMEKLQGKLLTKYFQTATVNSFVLRLSKTKTSSAGGVVNKCVPLSHLCLHDQIQTTMNSKNHQNGTLTASPVYAFVFNLPLPWRCRVPATNSDAAT